MIFHFCFFMFPVWKYYRLYLDLSVTYICCITFTRVISNMLFPEVEWIYSYIKQTFSKNKNLKDANKKYKNGDPIFLVIYGILLNFRWDAEFFSNQYCLISVIAYKYCAPEITKTPLYVVYYWLIKKKKKKSLTRKIFWNFSLQILYLTVHSLHFIICILIATNSAFLC